MIISPTVRFSRLPAFLILLVYLLVTPTSTSVLASNHIERISVGNTPLPPEEEYNSGFPAVNTDGRFVVFQSESIFAPTNQSCEGLYLRDRQNNTTEHINLDTDGTELCYAEDPYSINGDGRFVAFQVNRNSIYVRDRVTNTAEVASVADDGTPGNGQIGNPALSNDGRYVVFVSESTNFEPDLTPFAPNGTFYVYLRDRLLQTTRLVSIAPNGGLVGAQFLENKAPSISNDNRYISWHSPHDGVFLRDLVTNTTTQLAAGTDIPRGHSVVNGAGTIVVFSSDGSQLSVYDIASQTTQVLPLNVSRVNRMDVSDDGRFITFTSSSVELNGLILYDRLLQTSTNLGGNPPQFEGGEDVISGDGRFVIFESTDQILPEDQNEFYDVYLIDLTALPPSGPIIRTFTPSADTFVRTNYENQNEGGSTFFKINDVGNARSLIRFDQTALITQIGNRPIISAELRLTITNNEGRWGADGRRVDIHALRKDWGEGNGTQAERGTGSGATWNCAIDSDITNTNKNCDGVTEWHMGPEGNRPWVDTATDTLNMRNSTTGVIAFDVTADVQAYLNGTRANYGWVVRKRNEGQSGTAFFSSKEGANPPQLMVTYQP